MSTDTGPPNMDIDMLRLWIGRSESRRETLSSRPAALLAATLDVDNPEMTASKALPPLYHWLYFLPVCRQSKVALDGHPARGGFLPPIPLPRRMWAASQIRFFGPLEPGTAITRTTRIADVTLKEGRSGTLVFVKLEHGLNLDSGAAVLHEVQEIVYRDSTAPVGGPGVPQPAPPDPAWLSEICPDPVLLFRYSALTFNAHRIHYDRPYATQAEGYPSLVVHAPLVATLMMKNLLDRLPGAHVVHFEFRAVRPLFDTARFFVCAAPESDGKSFRLWSRDSSGALCSDARATIA